MGKRLVDKKMTLNDAVKKIKTCLRAAVSNGRAVAAEVTRLQTTLSSIRRATRDHNLLAVAREAVTDARVRLKFINRRLVDLGGYDNEVDSIMRPVPAIKAKKPLYSSKVGTEIERLGASIKRETDVVKNERLRSRTALVEMNHFQRLLNLPRADRGRIEVYYVNPHNHVVCRRIALGRIGRSFRLMAHLTELPRNYRIVKIMTGRHRMTYQTCPQRVVVEIAKYRVLPRSVYRVPPVKRDPQRSCRIRLIYLNPQGNVVKIHNSLGQDGAPFKLNQAIHLPTNYSFVKVINGLNVKQYHRREQLIELEIKSKAASPKKIHADEVQQAFLDYYNAQIMNVTPRGSGYSVRFGYHCAKQYLAGLADAYRGKSPQREARLYQRGYQVYRCRIAKRQISVRSFSDVLLKMYPIVIQDAALLDHDLKRGGKA